LHRGESIRAEFLTTVDGGIVVANFDEFRSDLLNRASSSFVVVLERNEVIDFDGGCGHGIFLA